MLAPTLIQTGEDTADGSAVNEGGAGGPDGEDGGSDGKDTVANDGVGKGELEDASKESDREDMSDNGEMAVWEDGCWDAENDADSVAPMNRPTEVPSLPTRYHDLPARLREAADLGSVIAVQTLWSS